MASLFDPVPDVALTDLPRATDGPESDIGDVFVGDMQVQAIDSNYWALRQRRIADDKAAQIEAMSEAVYGDPKAWRPAVPDMRATGATMGGMPRDPANIPDRETPQAVLDTALQQLFDDLAAKRQSIPGELANFPSSIDDMDGRAQANVRTALNAERDEAERRSSNRSEKTVMGGVAGFAGASVAAITDIEGMALLPFGGAEATLGRRLLVEGFLGAASEAATLPAYNAQADFLGRDRPDALQQVLFGAAFGTALPLAGRAIQLGANTVTPAGRIRNRDLIGFGTRPDATPEERGAARALAADEAVTETAPAASDTIAHSDNLDAVTGQLLADEPVRIMPSETVPAAGATERPGVTRQTLDFVRGLEARGDYDTVYDGIDPADRPQKPLTQMTISEVLAWQQSIDARYPSEAAGGYQIMEDTLRGLSDNLNLTGNELFDAAMQDRLAIALMREKGLDRYLAGEISAETFGNGLADVWAALPRVTAADAPIRRTATIGANAVSTDGLSDDAFAAFRLLERQTGRSFRINSAHRDAGRNAEVGGARSSQHIDGNAFDIDVGDMSIAERQALIVQARAAGFGGIGVYANSLHFDVGATRHWGPDHHAGSLPDWAADAVNAPRSAPRAGVSAYEGQNGNRALTDPGTFMGILTDPASYRPLDDNARAADIYSFRPDELRTDANAYQYKDGGDANGVTDRLRYEREWDPKAAVGVMVHERLDGERYIADGHQRLGLARHFADKGDTSIELQGFVYREADGWSVSQVRAMAALRNIRQESGTAIDAAKIIRDHPELTANISRTRGFMAQAEGLSRLFPGPFKAMVNDIIPQNYGAIVGRIIPDDADMQSVAIATLAKAAPANALQAESMVRDIRRMGLERRADDSQGSLFGDGFDLGESAIGERAQVLDTAMKELKRDRGVFARLSQETDRIEGAGNVLDTEANVSRERQAEKAIARLVLLADQDGPIRDALDAAARAVRAGTSIRDAAGGVIDAITARDRTDGAGAVARGADGDGPAPAAGGDADPLTSPPLAATGDAMAEPDLFGDPIESRGAQMQVDQLTRDIRARLATGPDGDLTFNLDGQPDNAISLSDMIADVERQENFLAEFKTCIPKG